VWKALAGHEEKLRVGALAVGQGRAHDDLAFGIVQVKVKEVVQIATQLLTSKVGVKVSDAKSIAVQLKQVENLPLCFAP
jgi:hypothetical protein